MRSGHNLSKRLAMLIDAQSVVDALRCGRTSAPTLRYELCNVAALSLATDVIVKHVFIPTEHNPADPPSRGVVNPAQRAGGSKDHRTKKAACESLGPRRAYYEHFDLDHTTQPEEAFKETHGRSVDKFL